MKKDAFKKLKKFEKAIGDVLLNENPKKTKYENRQPSGKELSQNWRLQRIKPKDSEV